MGWWTIRRDTRALYDPSRESAAVDESELLDIGDQPMDTIDSALRKVVKFYKRDLRRRPIPDELALLLESSIRTLEVELFDDMEERELESVVVKLKRRPKRPTPKPGDLFAMPLPTGGYGYGRVMKTALRVLLWMELLDVRSDDVLSAEDIRNARAILDLHTGTQKIDSVEWPIIGHVPFSEKEQAVLRNEPHWITNHTVRNVEHIAEWKLARKRGLPPGVGTPYEGYKD